MLTLCWAQDMYSTIDDAVKLVVANKVDRATEREVTFEQGAAFAKKVRCAKSRVERAVGEQCAAVALHLGVICHSSMTQGRALVQAVSQAGCQRMPCAACGAFVRHKPED